MQRRATTVFVLLAGLVWVFPGSAVAETFDLHIYTYCAPGSLCGFGSEDHHRRHLLRAVQEMNLEYEMLGISFHPIVHPIDSSNPEYYLVTGCQDRDGSWLCQDGTTECRSNADCDGEDCSCVGDCVCDDMTTSCGADEDCVGIGSGRCETRTEFRRQVWREEVADEHPFAITMMLTRGPNRCCSPIPVPGASPGDLYGIYCDGNRPLAGTLWAHEMGHYWGLWHTFGDQELADTTPLEPDHDGDTGSGVWDTPADPKGFSKHDRAVGLCQDDTPCGTDDDCGPFNTPCRTRIKDRHDWCTRTIYDADDYGSPHPTYCVTDCFRCLDGPCEPGVSGNIVTTFYAPDPAQAISYWGTYCRGPYVIGGQRYEAFSQDQKALVESVRQDYPQRLFLIDVCETHGGDHDFDGICDDEDNCTTPIISRSTRNTEQLDSDGDGLGDACDLAPLDFRFTTDYDFDGIGELIDPDFDADGCSNDIDQQPLHAVRQIGAWIHPSCAVETEIEYAIEAGDDIDGDSVPNCRDRDDDNDGVCDVGGPYEGSAFWGVLPGGCVEGSGGADPCPEQAEIGCIQVDPSGDCPPEWRVCEGRSCDAFALKVVPVEPGAQEEVVFPRFEIWNRTLYVMPLYERTVSETARAVEGADALAPVLSGGEARTPAGPVRLEIWSPATDVRVAVVADGYHGSDVDYGEISRGGVVAITPTFVGAEQRLTVRAAWLAGQGPDRVLADGDEDGWPDAVDVCVGVYDPRQADADGDGFGDACDPDLDGDDHITEDDLARIDACIGADLGPDTVEWPISEPAYLYLQLNGYDPPTPDPEAFELAMRCLGMDFDGDHAVSEDDLEIARSYLDRTPGPSARRNFAPIADGGPDQVATCAAPVLTLDGRSSYDPDGHRLTCHWSAPGCTLELHDACLTWAICPPGTSVVSLVVSDGTVEVVDDVSLFVPDCVAPGRIDESITVNKVPGGPPDDIVIRWPESCLPGAVDYAIMEGTIGDWYSHRGIDCSDFGADRAEIVQPGSGDRYYLVVPQNAQDLGSFGLDSTGAERPGDTSFDQVCGHRIVVAECPP